ncbi:MAG: biosynthetic-type acetolactate synthase large subunit [Tissierellaceae bacterium]
MERINGSRILLETLHRLGVRDVFGYPGGAVIPIYDEIYKFDKIRHYFSRHEQGAAHEADGYARASGKVGVCIATSGPGASNLVTGIMTAHMDSSPLLAITGQVGISMLGKDSFQESDIVGTSLPITKMNYLVTDIRDLVRIIKEGYYIARTGRPGPVLIDIPKDVQMAEMDMRDYESLYQEELNLPGYKPRPQVDKEAVEKALKLIRSSSRPLIIAGAGVIKSDSYLELREFAEKNHIPVTMTLLGLGGFPSQHHLSLGMLGMHGTVPANLATDEADLVIAAGIRFDDRITGDPEEFCKNAKIIHIDIDPAEIGKNKEVDLGIVADLKEVLGQFNSSLSGLENKDWSERIGELKSQYPMEYPKSENGRLMPQEVLEEVDRLLEGDAIIATDVGQNQMWAAQYLSFTEPKTIITSGGSGTMGFGLPSAIGAQVARPDKKVVAVVGDGGFQMTFHELMVAKQYELPIKILILNNSFLGMVRQWQEMFNEKRYSFVDLSVNPDFNKIAEAYGIRSATIENREEMEEKLGELLKVNEPVVVNFIVEKEANVLPMIPAGRTVHHMLGKRGVLDGA